ncbi:MAG: ral stress protein [Pseudomonadota bacterium]
MTKENTVKNDLQTESLRQLLLAQKTLKNDLQTESLRQLLLAQKTQLLEKIKQARGGLGGRAEAASNQLSAAEQSHAQNITERDNVFAMQEHDVAELEAIEQALARIAHGAYGKCLDCDHHASAGCTLCLALH